MQSVNNDLRNIELIKKQTTTSNSSLYAQKLMSRLHFFANRLIDDGQLKSTISQILLISSLDDSEIYNKIINNDYKYRESVDSIIVSKTDKIMQQTYDVGLSKLALSKLDTYLVLLVRKNNPRTGVRRLTTSDVRNASVRLLNTWNILTHKHHH